MPLLRGDSSPIPSKNILSDLKDFIEEDSHEVPYEDMEIFAEAYDAQIDRNVEKAKALYEELLRTKYKDNNAIQHNLELLFKDE